MEGSVSSDSVPKRDITIAETFDEIFPQYLAMGMTYEQFWEQDSSLVIPFRKAYKIRQEQENQQAWLQGLYIYAALGSVIGQAFSKRGTRIDPYPEKPFDFEEARRKKKAENNQAKMNAGIAYMQKMTAQFNQSFFAKQKKKASAAEQTNEPEKGGGG